MAKSETHELKFLERGMIKKCSGPSETLNPHQQIFERSAQITEENIYPRERGLFAHRYTRITITACPALRDGKLCGKVDGGLKCIKPYVISSPQELAAQPNDSQVTFKPGEDILNL